MDLLKLLRFALIFALLVGCYAFIEARMIRVRSDTVTCQDLPPAFDGLRVAFVADIHRGPFFSQARYDRLVAQVQALNPDLILLGGDYAITQVGATQYFNGGVGFSAPLGVYAILGNHDRHGTSKGFEQLKEAMAQSGAVPLINQVVSLERGGQRITLAGLDDYTTGRPDIKGVAAKTRAKDFVIVLNHNPDAVPKLAQAVDKNGQKGWADLVLCGHTHGAQVNIFGWTPVLGRVVRTGQRYFSGWTSEGAMQILTSNGVGTTGLPIRFMAPPEVCLITLRSAT